MAVVAPASPPDGEALHRGISMLKERYAVDILETAFARKGYLAGDDKLRARDLQRALDDETIHAVIAARGGFGTSRIIDRLDFQGLIRAPKWIVGSSDLTALSAHLLAGFHIASIHGPMVAGFSRTDPADVAALFHVLEGAEPLPLTVLPPLFPGRAEGPLVGGNLTVLAHLTGSLSRDFAKGAILFLEDVGEKPYRLDRCLTQLARAGMLDHIRGLVLGDFTDCDPNPDGVTAIDILKEFALQAKIPAARGYPAAHGNRNAPFIQGKLAVLEVGDTAATLSFSRCTGTAK